MALTPGTSSRSTEKQWLDQSESSTTLTKVGSVLNWDLESLSRPFATIDKDYLIASPADLTPGTYWLHLKNDTVGGHKITWGTAFDNWPGDVEPVLNAAPQANNILSFYCDGTALYGQLYYQTPII